MDLETYAILLKKIKNIESGNISPEQIKQAIDEFLAKNPIVEIATVDEIKKYLGIQK